MNPLGTFNPANYSQQNPLLVDAGLPPAYIRIINSSPYGLYVSFGGMGDTVFPEMFLEDFAITRAFNGKITFYPIANIINPSAALTNYLAINAFYPGEIVQPQAQPLTTMSNLGNTVPLNATATAVVNDGNAAGTVFVEGTATGDTSSDVKITNDGQAFFKNKLVLGTPGAGAVPFPSNLTLAQNGQAPGSGYNILADNPPGVAAGYALFGWSGSGYNRALLVNPDGSISLRLGTTIQGISIFSGVGSGTFNHGLGTTPRLVLPMQHAVGSQTMGYDSENATTVHITAGNGAAWVALAIA